MKNLLLVAERLSQLPLQQLADADSAASAVRSLDVSACCLDAPSGRLFLVTRSHLFVAYSVADHRVLMQRDLRRDGGVHEDDTVIAMRYLSELEVVVMASAGGALMTLATEGAPDAPPELQPVDHCRGGLADMSWSPDEELCVLLLRGGGDSGGMRVELRTKEFDVMYEAELFPSSAASGAPTPDQASQAFARFGTGSISWRGDGQFFVVNALDVRGSQPQRVTMVFDRNLEKQSAAAPVKPEPLDGSSDGMAVPLVWRPSGNLYFTAAMRYISSQLTKHELWAHEKNGLRHGEIALGNVVPAAASSAASSSSAAPSATAAAAAPKKKPAPRRKKDDDDDAGDDDDGEFEPNADVVDETKVDAATASSAQSNRVLSLSWNTDSDIFAVTLEDRATGNQSVLLYTMSNYHWYLKQEIRPSLSVDPSGRPTQLRALWHSEDARKLVVLESTGLVRTLDFIWDVTVSASSQARTAAVLDGQAVLLTPLAKQMVPPPMSAWKLLLDPSLGRVSQASFRASPLGVRGASNPNAPFTMPNQTTEAEAFVAESLAAASVGADDPSVQPLPPSASPALFSPTSDLLLLTSARRVVLLENIESLCGNGMKPSSIPVASLLARGAGLEFQLDSEDFPLGNLREMVWLDAATSGEDASSGSGSGVTPPPSLSSISESSPAMVLAIESGVYPACDNLVEMEVWGGEIQAMFRTPVAASGGLSVLRISAQKKLGHVFVQLSSGRVLRYLPACWQPHLALDDRVPVLEGLGSMTGPAAVAAGQLSLPTGCPWFGVVRLGGVLHPMGRDSLGKLFVSGTLLTPQCSSFLADQHPSYIPFTILGQQNAAFLLDRSISLEANLSEEHRADPNAVRLLERGSSLVAVLPSLSAPRLLLQMPRGNLEGIYPRLLTLGSLNSALSSLRFPEAFESLRRNKIDTNLLVDHFGLQGFARVAAELVDQISRLPQAGRAVELMNLLISGLTDESCLVNQYVAYKPRPLTMEAQELLARKAGALVGGGAGGNATDGIRERLLRTAAAARAAQARAAAGAAGGGGGGDDPADDGASDLDSVGSASRDASRAAVGSGDSSADTLAPHDAVGEDKPYNYVPRKPGQSSRRAQKTSQERKARSAGVKSREEERRAREKSDRAEREALAAAYEASLATATADSSSKVNFVCALLRSIFLSRPDKDAWTLCVLTTYLREEPKQYDAALNMVKEMREKERAAAAGATQPAATATSAAAAASVASSRSKESSSTENKSRVYSGWRGALTYMIFLSDIESLYEHALGIYDFELVKLVAQESNMDPKEYIAFIEGLQAMDMDSEEPAVAAGVAGTASAAAAAPRKRTPHFQHYTIDLHLGRYSKALASLLSAWSSNEIEHDEKSWGLVLSLLKSHPDLYPQALQTLSPERMRNETRLVLAGGGGGGGSGGFGMRASESSMYGSSQPFDPTGGLPAHFLNPSLAPPSATVAPSSSSFSASSGSSPASTGSTPAPDAELVSYNSLLCAYAAHLSSTLNSPRHAAHAYLLACEYPKALQCLKDAGEWKECMALAHQIGYKQEQLQQLAYDVRLPRAHSITRASEPGLIGRAPPFSLQLTLSSLCVCSFLSLLALRSAPHRDQDVCGCSVSARRVLRRRGRGCGCLVER